MDDNVLMMRCSHCGEMNRLPVVHCKRCGAKLDFEAAEEQMKTGGGPTVSQRLQTGVKVGVALLLAGVILLVIWPGRMTRTVGEPVDARRYRVKAEMLVDALNRGMPGAQEITEAEINAHLHELLARQPGRRGWSPVLKDLGVRFFEGRAELFVAVGRGPLTLTALYRARVKDSAFVVTSARAGHLPLPGILGRLYSGTQTGLLKQMRSESRVLRNLEGASVKDGSVELLVKLGQ